MSERTRRTLIFALFLVAAAISISSWHLFHEPDRRDPDPKHACLSNLLAIQGAKELWAAEQHKPVDDLPTDADLFGPGRYLEVKPTCPTGGTYILGKVSEEPRCTIPSHVRSP